MAFHKKGQGATEYLVLLAVVLIIALVSIALLGFFPGLATDAKMTQSTSYWRSEARPYAILESSVVATDGNVTLVLENVEASGTFTLTNISASSASGTGNYNTSTTFAPGEIKPVTFILSNPGAAGSLYEITVNMTYTSPNSITNTQYGSKTVMGKYN